MSSGYRTIGGLEAVESRLQNGKLFWRLSEMLVLPEAVTRSVTEAVRQYVEKFYKGWPADRLPSCIRVKFVWRDNAPSIYRIGRVPTDIEIAKAITPSIQREFAAVHTPRACELDDERLGDVESMKATGIIRVLNWCPDLSYSELSNIQQRKRGHLVPCLPSGLCVIRPRDAVSVHTKNGPESNYMRVHMLGVRHDDSEKPPIQTYDGKVYSIDKKLRIATRDAEELGQKYGSLLCQKYMPPMKLDRFSDLNCVYALYFSLQEGNPKAIGGVVMAAEQKHFWVKKGPDTGYAPLLV
jgi:hypothetical protein